MCISQKCSKVCVRSCDSPECSSIESETKSFSAKGGEGGRESRIKKEKMIVTRSSGERPRDRPLEATIGSIDRGRLREKKRARRLTGLRWPCGHGSFLFLSRWNPQLKPHSGESREHSAREKEAREGEDNRYYSLIPSGKTTCRDRSRSPPLPLRPRARARERDRDFVGTNWPRRRRPRAQEGVGRGKKRRRRGERESREIKAESHHGKRMRAEPTQRGNPFVSLNELCRCTSNSLTFLRFLPTFNYVTISNNCTKLTSTGSRLAISFTRF